MPDCHPVAQCQVVTAWMGVFVSWTQESAQQDDAGCLWAMHVRLKLFTHGAQRTPEPETHVRLLPYIYTATCARNLLAYHHQPFNLLYTHPALHPEA